MLLEVVVCLLAKAFPSALTSIPANLLRKAKQVRKQVSAYLVSPDRWLLAPITHTFYT